MNQKKRADADGPSLISANLHADLAEAGSLTNYIDELNRQAYLRAFSLMTLPASPECPNNKPPHP